MKLAGDFDTLLHGNFSNFAVLLKSHIDIEMQSQRYYNIIEF